MGATITGGSGTGPIGGALGSTGVVLTGGGVDGMGLAGPSVGIGGAGGCVASGSTIGGSKDAECVTGTAFTAVGATVGNVEDGANGEFAQPVEMSNASRTSADFMGHELSN